ncbi:uncharacterized protein TNCV_46581 [Trichonephila clavipes]|nr:uncharacterized protein TNCV_46581 [Trichonephila clavipes]
MGFGLGLMDLGLMNLACGYIRLFTVKLTLLFNGQNKSNSTSVRPYGSFEKNPLASKIVILVDFSTYFKKNPKGYELAKNGLRHGLSHQHGHHRSPIDSFADDILVCSQGRDLSETFLHAQEALNFASDWSKSFKLEFNPDKTRFMAIEKRNVCYDAFQLYLDGTPLTMVKQMKYLGVLLDTKFSWKQHLSYISEKCDKLQRGLNRIARNMFGINFNVHSLIYKQGIEPFILYGSRVWGEALKRKMNSKYLRRIQRRILLRVVCGYRTISYDSVYAISGFPPIDITILHDIAFRENLSASSISNYQYCSI